MKRLLFLTTAMCGVYALPAAAATPSGTITTTTTTTYSYDFPDSVPKIIDMAELKEENCRPCTVYVPHDKGQPTEVYDLTLDEWTELDRRLREMSRNGTKDIDLMSYAIEHIMEVSEAKKEGFGVSNAMLTKSFSSDKGTVISDDKCTYIRGGPSCFVYDTRVLMKDGSLKKIGKIAAGDETVYGIVNQTYIRRFDQSRAGTRDFHAVYQGGLFEYRGILVTGNHIVRDSARWVAVAGLDGVRPVFAPHVENVYNLDVEGGIIPVAGADGEVVAFLDDKQAFIAQRLSA